MDRRVYIWLYSGYSISVYNYTHYMTQLTDKMEGLIKDTPNMFDIGSERSTPKIIRDNGFNQGVTASIGVIKAETAVVGDWEAEFDNRFLLQAHIKDKAGNTSIHSVEKINIKTFTRNLLTAKDNETAEAYKKGFIDGGLSK